MKKLLCVVLLLLIGVVPAMAGASEENEPVEHLLWDIPFGIGVEECKALVFERFGVELPYSHNSDRSVTYIVESEQGVTFFDHPAELRATIFVPEDELRFFELWVFDDSWHFSMMEGEDETLVTEGFARAVREAIEVNRELQNLYGAPTGGRMLVGEKVEGVERDYFLPMHDGLLDEVLAERIFTRFGPTEDGAALLIYYDNVEVSIQAHSMREWGDEIRISVFMYLGYSAWGRFNQEEAHSFEARNGEFSFRQLEEEKQ